MIVVAVELGGRAARRGDDHEAWAAFDAIHNAGDVLNDDADKRWSHRFFVGDYIDPWLASVPQDDLAVIRPVVERLRLLVAI